MRSRRPAKLRDACCYVSGREAVRLDDEFGMLGLEGRRLAHHLARVGVVTAEQVVARPGTLPSQRLDAEGSGSLWRTRTRRRRGPPEASGRQSDAPWRYSRNLCFGVVRVLCPSGSSTREEPGRIDLLAENTRRPELRVPHGFLDIQ